MENSQYFHYSRNKINSTFGDHNCDFIEEQFSLNLVFLYLNSIMRLNKQLATKLARCLIVVCLSNFWISDIIEICLLGDCKQIICVTANLQFGKSRLVFRTLISLYIYILLTKYLYTDIRCLYITGGPH